MNNLKDEKNLEFVKQANDIAMSVYMMPASCRKLIFFVMAKSAYQDEGFETIESTEDEVCKSLGLTRGGTTYNVLRSITKQTKEQVFTIEDDGYNHVSWMAECQYIQSRGVFRFRLDPILYQYTVAIKKQFQIIPLDAIGKLQGKYTLRIFELIMTQSGQEGKNGNPPGEWWYEDTIEMLRHRFEIPTGQYKVPYEFRRNIIDLPVKEINDAGIGIQIKPVYFYKRRRLYAVRFNVRRITATNPANVNPVTASEKEDEALIKRHPEEYKLFLEEELKQKQLAFVSKEMAYRDAEARVIIRLRELELKSKSRKVKA